MNWGVVIGVVGTVMVAVVTVVGGWITARAGRSASPYDVVIKRVVELEQQRVEDVERIEKLQRDVRAIGQERANLHTEVAGLQRRVIGIVADRDDLVRYITVLRAWIASGAKPPAPAVPTHLADVLPAWVPGDGAEPPARTDRP